MGVELGSLSVGTPNLPMATPACSKALEDIPTVRVSAVPFSVAGAVPAVSGALIADAFVDRP